MKFRDIKNNEVKEAFKIENKGENVYIQFKEHGKVYKYNKSNIELIQETTISGRKNLVIYRYIKKCNVCKRETEILTYIVFDSTDIENLCYPWDKNRLNRSKTIEQTLAHMKMSEIEFYPVKVLGDDEYLDEIMLRNYSNRISKQYSETRKKKYPMNICQHCGAKQGWFYVYSDINKMIQQMKEIEIIQTVNM